MILIDLKKTFDRDGLLKIEPFFGEERMQEIESELTRYVKEIVPSLLPDDVLYETGSGGAGRPIRLLVRMEEHSGYFSRLAETPEILELVGTLVNGEAVSTGVELFAKPAQVGAAVPYHQDNAYFNLTPPDSLTFWLALDDSGTENGCVFYARGSHRQGLRRHCKSSVRGNSLRLADIPEPGGLEEVPGILRRGGVILHHCLTVHRSEKNLSPRSRRGLLIVYKAVHCELDRVGWAEYQTVLQAAQRDQARSRGTL